MPANYTPEEISNFLEQFFNVVGTRQYIGARYVPMFGRQGEESIEWDNTAPYEPLTIVLYQGNSYTSRTYVPTGALLTDTRYWVETGNYSGQIEAYREEVLAFDGRIRDVETGLGEEETAREQADLSLQQEITKLREKPILLVIGDSFTVGQGVTTSWAEYVANATKYTLKKYANGGIGFLATGSVGKTFQTKAQESVAELTTEEKSRVEHIIIYGGLNDLVAASSVTDLVSAAQTLVNYLNENYANATIHLVAINSRIALNPTHYHRALDMINGFKAIAGCNFVDSRYLLTYKPTAYQDDDTHPTALGQAYIANFMIGVISGNSILPSFRFPITVNSTFSENSTFAYGMLDRNTGLIYFNGAIQCTEIIPASTPTNFGTIPTPGINAARLPVYDPVGKQVGIMFFSSTTLQILCWEQVAANRRLSCCGTVMYES